MRKLVVILAVLILLVVGLDIGGRALAESKAGEAIGAKTGGTAPSVSIHGFSFLVQALPGHYSNITLSSDNITAGPITGIAATMDLYQVTFPLGDAIKGDTSHLHADQASLRGQIAAANLAAAIAKSGALGQAGVTITGGTGGTIVVGSTVSVAGRTIPVSTALTASFSAKTLHLTAGDLTAAGVTVPNGAALTRALSIDLPLTGLPFAVDAATLTSSGSDLILTATASNVSMSSIG